MSICDQLLHVIAHKASLKQMSGDVENVVPKSFTNNKVYACRMGKKFGELEGKKIMIKRALYGLCSSAQLLYHTHVGDILCIAFGFKQTHFDTDVWIHLDRETNRNEYIYMHVDDYMIILELVRKEIELVYY